MEDHLRMAVKECKNLDLLLAEAEDEGDKLITKLELMERELHTLKVENHQLKIINQLRSTLGGNAGEENRRKHISDDIADSYEQPGDSDVGDEVVLLEQIDLAVSQTLGSVCKPWRKLHRAARRQPPCRPCHRCRDPAPENTRTRRIDDHSSSRLPKIVRPNHCLRLAKQVVASEGSPAAKSLAASIPFFSKAKEKL
ncbi:unnamed protein product [Linum trigynum]|uniref:Uncharacterized protein n=1 Tax=Linum trigynum TaxID=586398 RepID=A0AAV2CHH9_9ROSI